MGALTSSAKVSLRDRKRSVKEQRAASDKGRKKAMISCLTLTRCIRNFRNTRDLHSI